MAESSFHVLPNKRARHGFRYQLELKFETEDSRRRRRSGTKWTALSVFLLPDLLRPSLLDNMEELAAEGIVTTATDRVCPGSDRSHVVPRIQVCHF